MKQKPIHKIQTRRHRVKRKTQKRNDCGFCGQKMGHLNITVRQNGKMQQLSENKTLVPRKTKQQRKQNNFIGRYDFKG